MPMFGIPGTRVTPDFYFTYGVCSSYWTINDEVTITPGVQAAWKPDWYREDSSSKKWI